jgi:very-short-patch-repair endonuclease
MKIPHIISGQPVDPVKQNRAKELRREMTPAERALWARLRRDQLHGLHFRRQQVIHGLIADFYCHAAGVIVELDGPVHEGRQGYDTERDGILRGYGFRIVRFTNDQVLGAMDQVLEAIAAACGVGPNPSPQPPSPKAGGGPCLPPPPALGEGAGGRGLRP